jgi:flavin-binding protein dodecin
MMVMPRLGKPCAPAAEGKPSAAMPARVARRVSMGDSGESGRPELYVVAGVWSKSQEAAMQDHIYKVVELVGSSETSIEDAISAAISRANETVRHLRWFEVVQTRGHVENGKISHYQVTLKVGFTMEKAD